MSRFVHIGIAGIAWAVALATPIVGLAAPEDPALEPIPAHRRSPRPSNPALFPPVRGRHQVTTIKQRGWRPARIAASTSASLGLATLTAGIVFGFQAQSRHDMAGRQIEPAMARTWDRRGDAARRRANGMYVATGVLLSTAVALLVYDFFDEEPAGNR